MIKLGDYTHNVSPRKRVYLPVYPFAVTPETDIRTTTTTAILRTVSDVKFGGISGSIMGEIGARLETNGQYVIIPWRVPDDFYNQEDAAVRFLFSFNNTTTTAGGVLSPVLTAGARQIGDVNLSSPTAETLKATPTELTWLDEDLTIAATHVMRACYRSTQGTIAKQTIGPGDLVYIKVALDAAPTGGALMLLLGIEVDYPMALRDTEPEVIY